MWAYRVISLVALATELRASSPCRELRGPNYRGKIWASAVHKSGPWAPPPRPQPRIESADPLWPRAFLQNEAHMMGGRRTQPSSSFLLEGINGSSAGGLGKLWWHLVCSRVIPTLGGCAIAMELLVGARPSLPGCWAP
jgi:hypothetical protein